MTRVDLVVKLGGSALRDPSAYDCAALALSGLRGRRALVVPGGGPLADEVRALGATLRVDDDSAHWMAVLAMDQHAELLAARVDGGALVSDPTEIGDALDAGEVPILAPYRWLRDVDPLPHGWIVTSDSIAAWVATVLGAPRLIVVKAVEAPLASLVDPWFHRALGAGVRASVLALHDISTLPEMLSQPAPVGARR